MGTAQFLQPTCMICSHPAVNLLVSAAKVCRCRFIIFTVSDAVLNCCFSLLISFLVTCPGHPDSFLPPRASEVHPDHYTSRSNFPTVISTEADTFYRQLQYSTALTSTIPTPAASVIPGNGDFEVDAVIQLLQTIHSSAAISVMYCDIRHTSPLSYLDYRSLQNTPLPRSASLLLLLDYLSPYTNAPHSVVCRISILCLSTLWGAYQPALLPGERPPGENKKALRAATRQ